MKTSNLPGGATANASWEARPWAARAVRTFVLLGPVALGCVAAIAANRVMPVGTSGLVNALRSMLIVAMSSCVVWCADVYARRLLPLATLFQLSLVFPDQAPSRIRSAARAGSSRRLQRNLEEARQNGLSDDAGDAARQVIGLIGAIGDHDRRTRGHSERVRLFADLIGEELHLTKEERQKLQWGALLHDLGKIMVPAEILNKAGKPTAEEWAILQGHPAAGMELIAPLREFLGEWVHAVGGHHEKWDGTGYPNGLVGGQIPRAAAIVAVADSFEVMTAVRSYKQAMTLEDARAELTRCAGLHFAPDPVRAMLSVSLGHIRLVMGPLASLAHLPFLTSAVDATTRLATLSPVLTSAVSAPVAAMATVATVGMGFAPAPPPAATPTPTELASVAPGAPRTPNQQSPAAAKGEQRAPGRSSADQRDGSNPDGTDPAPDPNAPDADGQPRDASPQPSDGIGPDGTDPSGPNASGSPGPLPRGLGGAPVPDPAPRPAQPISTTAPPRPTLPPPSTTLPPPPPSPTPPPTAPPTGAAQAPAILVSISPTHDRAIPLSGARLMHSSPVFVFLGAQMVQVRYIYPGGQSLSATAPYDLLGLEPSGPRAYLLPSAPGTYTISATVAQGTAINEVTATFTIV